MLLHIGAERTSLADATLAVGWHSIARDYFRHDPPSPLELENAIAAVEDELARAHDGIAKGTTLLTDNSAIGEIAVAGGEFAATLLILRELMHHLDFPAILIRA